VLTPVPTCAQIPAHTLSLLPSLLPLLSALPFSSPFRASLLETIQLAIFNVENLKRGLARDSYAAGSAEQSTVSTADSELLAALSSVPPAAVASSYAALPSFTNIYASALAAHAAILFPLPAKANFPTPSAQKSALEVLGLVKRRELAGRWTNRVVAYLEWARAGEGLVGSSGADEGDKASSLAGVLEEVERADLYRAGQAEESWAAALVDVVSGTMTRLEQSSADAAARDALVGVLGIVSRIDHSALEPYIPRALAVLAQAPSPTATASASSTTSTFLSDLVTFHSRSLTIPTLLSLLSDAFASASTARSSTHDIAVNSVLTAHAFTEQLERAVRDMTTGSTASRATWECLVAPIREALAPSAASTPIVEEVAPSPAKKRKLSSAIAPTVDVRAVASRLRVATIYVRGVPATALAALVDPLQRFVEEVVDSRLKDFIMSSCVVGSSTPESDAGTPGKKDKKRRRASGVVAGKNGELDPAARLGVELLELRYAAVERLSREGLLEGDRWWDVTSRRRDELREVVEAGAGESAVEAVRPSFSLHLRRAPKTDSPTVPPSAGPLSAAALRAQHAVRGLAHRGAGSRRRAPREHRLGCQRRDVERLCARRECSRGACRAVGARREALAPCHQVRLPLLAVPSTARTCADFSLSRAAFTPRTTSSSKSQRSSSPRSALRPPARRL